MNNAGKPEEVWTTERCYITELMNHPDSAEVSIARARVEPSVHTQLHTLTVAEWYIIESGQGLMSVGDDEPYQVGPGDVVSISKGVPQRILNNGEDDLIFICVCTPRFEMDCYTSLE
jgi:mannose-6-phosphate isomerase-like protein (cupin superfamily)